MLNYECNLLGLTQKPLAHCSCALENGADLHVNECHKIRHYRGRSTGKKKEDEEEEEKCQIAIFFTSRGAYVNLSDVIHLFHWKSAVEHDGGV